MSCVCKSTTPNTNQCSSQCSNQCENTTGNHCQSSPYCYAKCQNTCACQNTCHSNSQSSQCNQCNNQCNNTCPSQCDNLCPLPEPAYTADVSDGYIQNLNCAYYRALTENVEFTCGESAVFVVYNPENSCVNLLISNLYYNNYSKYRLEGIFYLYGLPKGTLIPSTHIVNSNTSSGSNIKGLGELYSGKNIEVTNGEISRVIIIDPLATTRTDSTGSLLLAPGMAYILKVRLLEETTDSVTFGFGINWWEEPISLN